MNKLMWMMPLCGAMASVAFPQDPQGQLEEVLVTAERREENIQDVPNSVSVVRGEDLDVLAQVGPVPERRL